MGKFRPHIISDKSLRDRRQCVTICTANQLLTYTIGLSVNTDNNRSSTECENVTANKLKDGMQSLHDVEDDKCKQDAQLSQRDRAAGCVIVFNKSRRLEV